MSSISGTEFLKSLISGGVAGMCAKTAVAPLERMKILLQAQSKHYSHLGVFSGLRTIIVKEGFAALYKGNGAHMVRVFPYAATKFASFELYKKLIFGEHKPVGVGQFVAGSLAGLTSVGLTYPLDTIRARLSFQVQGEHGYGGIIQCATFMFQKEGGIMAFYKGFVPTMLTIIPYAGLSFYCFDLFKNICVNYFPNMTCQETTTGSGVTISTPFKLVCGGIAGAVAQTVSYPLDVARRRMQLAMMEEDTHKFGKGMAQTLKLIFQENGIIRGFYRGMSINYMRAIPMAAVTFSTYDLLKSWFDLDVLIPDKIE